MADRSGEPPAPRINVQVLVIGVLLGVLLSWVLTAVLLLVVSSAVAGAGGFVVAVVLPALVGVALLSSARTRQAATGFLIGLAVGLITGAGVCSALAVGVA